MNALNAMPEIPEKFVVEPAYRGKEFVVIFELSDAESHQPIGFLSELTLTADLLKGDELCLSTSSRDGGIRTNASGHITFKLVSDETSALEPGDYQFRLTIERDGVTEQQFVGSLPVVMGVAR